MIFLSRYTVMNYFGDLWLRMMVARTSSQTSWKKWKYPFVDALRVLKRKYFLLEYPSFKIHFFQIPWGPVSPSTPKPIIINRYQWAHRRIYRISYHLPIVVQYFQKYLKAARAPKDIKIEKLLDHSPSKVHFSTQSQFKSDIVTPWNKKYLLLIFPI